MSAPIPKAARCSGWWRRSPAVPWRWIVTADDNAACWGDLLARQLPSGDFCVCQGDPNEREQRPGVPNDAKGSWHKGQSCPVP